MRQPTIMAHDFSRIQGNQIERSKFIRPFTHKTTIDAGYLVPVYVDEILPGDSVKIDTTAVGRVLSFLYPLMDNLTLSLFWFFDPCRLLWVNWEKFMGARDNPGDSIDFLIPTLDLSSGYTVTQGSLADYFGLPIVAFATTEKINALPFRMYCHVHDEWFRDTQLQGDIGAPTDDGPDSLNIYSFGGTNVPLRRGKRHDYFTTCRTAPQLGDAVALPLGASAQVYGTGQPMLFDLGPNEGSNPFALYTTNAVNETRLTETFNESDVVGDTATPNGPDHTGSQFAGYITKTMATALGIDSSRLYADLSTATAATITEIREAFAIQQIRELDNRGGSRYVEQLKQVFGVISPDFRLQRPEYLGGTRERMGLRAVNQTTANPAVPTLADNKGSMSATGEVIASSHIRYSAVEHGYIMCLACIDADLTYQYGLKKMWSRQTRYEFFRPETAHLGDQAVLNKEIFYPANGTNANGVFGYQDRWGELKYMHSQITGKFRSNASGTLHAWHLSEMETAIPTLDAAWIVSDPPIDRTIAVPDEPHMMLDIYCNAEYIRPIPTYSNPGMRRL